MQIDLETLDTYVQASYPDLRKCINLVQQNVVAIPKTANLGRLKENSNIYDFNLDESDMEQIFGLQRNQRLVPNLESNESLYPWD